jgi:hypothetical protein
MITISGITIDGGIYVFDTPVVDIYTNLTSEDGVTQLLTEDGDNLVIE